MSIRETTVAFDHQVAAIIIHQNQFAVHTSHLPSQTPLKFFPFQHLTLFFSMNLLTIDEPTRKKNPKNKTKLETGRKWILLMKQGKKMSNSISIPLSILYIPHIPGETFSYQVKREVSLLSWYVKPYVHHEKAMRTFLCSPCPSKGWLGWSENRLLGDILTHPLLSHPHLVLLFFSSPPLL